MAGAVALAGPGTTATLAQGLTGPDDATVAAVRTDTQPSVPVVSRAGLRGCGSGQQNVAAPAISDLPRVNINIYDTFFDPADVTVAPGTVVVWTNHGTKPHSTTAWNRWSEVLQPGEACVAWFVTPGSYQYLSIVATDGGALTGTVNVGGTPIPSGPSSTMGMGPGPMPGLGMLPGMGPGNMPSSSPTSGSNQSSSSSTGASPGAGSNTTSTGSGTSPSQTGPGSGY